MKIKNGKDKLGKPMVDPALVAKAEASYLKAIQANGNQADYQYNLGALYYNNAVEVNKQMNAIAGSSAAEIKKYEALKKQRDEVEIVNKADSTIFQTERQLKEYGDKIPADKKQPIEDALAELKKEFDAKNVENLEPAMEKLNTVFQAASQEMYNAANAQGGASTEGGTNKEASAASAIHFSARFAEIPDRAVSFSTVEFLRQDRSRMPLADILRAHAEPMPSIRVSDAAGPSMPLSIF